MTFTHDSPSQGITMHDIDPSLWAKPQPARAGPGVAQFDAAVGRDGQRFGDHNDRGKRRSADCDHHQPRLRRRRPNGIYSGVSGASSAVTVGYSVWNGSSSGPTTGSLVFGTSTGPQAIPVTAYDDQRWAWQTDSESMSVILSLPPGVGGTTSSAATIVEDSDDKPTINVSGPTSIPEGQPGPSRRRLLTANRRRRLSPWATRPGTAAADLPPAV